jgi:hypothetical protein
MSALVLACLLSGSTPPDSLSILFIGNSHTYVNNVPMMVESLATAGGHRAVTAMSAPGGYALMEHAVYQPTLESIARGGWDYVVLQEQSQIPVIPYWRDSGMYPASRTLDSLIRACAGRTAFYMTWGWKYGGTHTYRGHTSPTFPDYFEMQDSVAVAYQRIANELGATICPVGLAWRLARTRDSLVDLWQADNCHATLKGSYLGACVFYARLFDANPVGLHYFAGLDSVEALWLQQIAWEATSEIEEPSAPQALSITLRVSPNPCRGMATIRLSPFAMRHVPLDLRVYDAQGRVVLSHPVRTSSLVLRTSSFSPGVHVAVLRDNRGVRTTTKLLKLD